MATVVLGALGTLVGGPLGGAIGALAGRQLDSQIIGGGSREGPRLKELAVTTSSYGTPIAKHYGTMRVAGSIIWGTELKESKETSGGGKGKPKTTAYSYSSSFAVALASRPIRGIGRIWADGNLLRGAAGDLKVGGALRVHQGHGDQMPDPLIASAQNGICPAFRGCAYVVFEDLQLADFGNRLPALTFEVFADEGALSADTLLGALIPEAESNAVFSGLTGFSYEGGALVDTLDVLTGLYPAAIDSGGQYLSLTSIHDDTPPIITLPLATSGWEEGDFGEAGGTRRDRSAASARPAGAIRYYDIARDYQPGIQRKDGRASNSNGAVVEFPGALDADTARNLLGQAASRSLWSRDRIRWRVAELNPLIEPGSRVALPGIDGHWIIDSWEWRERGVELDLRRASAAGASSSASSRGADSGEAVLAPDDIAGPTLLQAFELPWDGTGSVDQRAIFAAIGSAQSGWKGAALYIKSGEELVPAGPSGRTQSIFGTLAEQLPASPPHLLNPDASLVVDLHSATGRFESLSASAVAMGRNRLLVGTEIVQFCDAERLTETRWRLSGLLRGRGGTESVATQLHPAGAPVVLLGSELVTIDTANVDPGADPVIAAIGHGDATPVLSPVIGSGATLKPLAPVHPEWGNLPDGGLKLCWTRRARGAWSWLDGLETPLNEESERYRVGIGDSDAPQIAWEVSSPEIVLSAAQRAEFSGLAIWVKQLGRIAQSDPLLLRIID